ncbi:MAG TPA: TonB-dependent receptor [Anaeromyxobacter sp.]|nr:TonB-dependent receptor [Anaeromyxobacter sp.]
MACAPDVRRGLSLLLAALTLLVPSLGRADDATSKVEIGALDLRSLLDLSVEAVTRREERASEAPATVFVLTGDDIRRQGFRTVEEVLGSVPGLFSYPGRFPQVGVRGLGIIGDFTTRLLVLIDGHPLTNSVGADLERGIPVPLSAISRIEVIKGPVGSVYGPTAFFGVVNLVTTGGAEGSEGWVGGEAAQGEATAWEGSATWRGSAGQAEVLLSTDLYNSSGRDFTYPELAGTPGAPADGTVRGMDFGDAQNVYLRTRWRGLTLSGACDHSHGGIPVTAYPTQESSLDSSTCLGEVALEGEVARDLSLKGRASYDWFHQSAVRNFPPPPTSVGIFRDGGDDRWPTAELRADWHPQGPLRLGAGSTLQLHQVTVHSYSSDVSDLDVRFHRDFQTSNTWVLAELRLLEGLALHGGLNFYDHSIFGHMLTPKLAAVWQPSPDDTVKAIWSRGFRPPTYVEALLDDRAFFIANPSLEPETVSSSELAYEHRFGDHASTTASAFWNEYQRLIGYVTVPVVLPPDPSNPNDFRQIAENGGRLDLVGGEVALVLRFGDALQAWGGLSVQHLSERSRPNFPEVTGNLAVSSRALWHPLLLSLRAAGVGPRAKDPTTLTPGTSSEVPAAVVVSGLAALDVPGVRGLQLELGLLNLFDARAESPAPGEDAPVTELPVAPRTLRFDLRYRF